MPPAQPDGDLAPEDGLLPDEAWAEFGSRPFGLYVHVPFCSVRCGYCDFNTYTAHDLVAIVASAAAEFGLVDDVEITTEANPDSVAAWDLEELRTAGFNRISFGMQSAVDHVLRTLDRTHDPMRVPAVVDWARQAGFDDVSLDLIYGTPGESTADWETSVDSPGVP